MTEFNNTYIRPKKREQPTIHDLRASQALVVTSTSGPGWTSAITSPAEIGNAFDRIRKGVFGTDTRLILDGFATAFSQICAFVYGWVTVGDYIATSLSIGSFLFHNLNKGLLKAASIAQTIFGHPVAKYTAFGLGAIISLINITYESIGISRHIDLRRHLKFSEKIAPKNTKEKFANLIQYLTFNHQQSKELADTAATGNKSSFDILKDDAEETTLIKMSELMGPALARELKDEIHTQYTNLTSPDEDLQNKALVWLQDEYDLINIQSKKALIVHSVGLAAISLSVLATVITFTAFPGAPLVFVLLILLSIGLSTARYVIHEGYFNSRGWVYRPANLVPLFIREQVNKFINALTPEPTKDITSKNEEEPPVEPRLVRSVSAPDILALSSRSPSRNPVPA